MCEHNEIIGNGGNDKMSANDMMNAIAFDDYIDNENENVGILVGDRENDTSRMKILNIISTSQQHTDCFEEDYSLQNINTSRNDHIHADGENVVATRSIAVDNDDLITDDFLQDPQFTKIMSTDRTDSIMNGEFTLHEIGSHCFIEKELQLFRDARHESLCYNDNGKMIRCNMCQQDFSPVDLVDNTIKKKKIEFGGLYQEAHLFVSLLQFLITNCFTDNLNLIRFQYSITCSPVNMVP